MDTEHNNQVTHIPCSAAPLFVKQSKNKIQNCPHASLSTTPWKQMEVEEQFGAFITSANMQARDQLPFYICGSEFS